MNVLTIEPISQEKDVLTILFRVEHIYDRNEHSQFSKAVSIPIAVGISDDELDRYVRMFCFFQETFPSSSFSRSKRSDIRWKYVQIRIIQSIEMEIGISNW